MKSVRCEPILDNSDAYPYEIAKVVLCVFRGEERFKIQSWKILRYKERAIFMVRFEINGRFRSQNSRDVIFDTSVVVRRAGRNAKDTLVIVLSIVRGEVLTAYTLQTRCS